MNRQDRLNLPRSAICEKTLQNCGTFWKDTEHGWAWKTNNGARGFADTAKLAISQCCATYKHYEYTSNPDRSDDGLPPFNHNLIR